MSDKGPATGRSQTDGVPEIRRSLGVLFESGDVVEVRIPKPRGRRRTISGYFDDFDALAAAVRSWDGKCEAVYITLNPCKPELLARSANRLTDYAEYSTADTEILRRRWLLIDCDPVRPAHISASSQEHQAALDRTKEVREYLKAQGWPEPVLADSGNGGHLLYCIDLPPDEEGRIERALKALAFLFDDEAVKIDQGVFNPARIVKLYGTIACKGDNMPDRPHRKSHIVEAPASLEVVSSELLETLAAKCPEQPDNRREGRTGQDTFDLEQWIEDNRLPVVSNGPWQNGWRWILNPCPWNPAHNNRAAFIVQLANGAIAAGCHHNGCEGKGWADLRDLYGTDRREHKAQEITRRERAHPCDLLSESGNPECVSGSVSKESADADDEVHITARLWPDPLAPEAFHGLAGEAVHLLEPYTEADPAALLTSFLVAFGSVIGRAAFFVAEADRHYANLFVVEVGTTSKSRKGSSLGQIRKLFNELDPKWASDCIQSGLSSGEGLIWAVRDKVEKNEPIKDKGRVVDYQSVVVDDGVLDKRLLAVETEFANTLRVLERDGNTLSAILRNAWDSGDLRILTKNSPGKSTGAHISIIGHITRDELLRYLDSTETGNGFGNRFLWCCVRRSKVLPEGGRIPDDCTVQLRNHLAKAIQFTRNVQEMSRDEPARKLWREVYPELSEGKPGLLGAMIARAEAQVMRLACIYALLDSSAVVRVEHLRAALSVWRYAEDSARFIFGDSLGDPVADELLRALKSSTHGMTRTDISNHFGRNKHTKEIGRALSLLIERSLVQRENDSSGEGRPVERWLAVRCHGNAPAVRQQYEKNEIYENAPARVGVNSLDSFISYPQSSGTNEALGAEGNEREVLYL